MSAVSGELIASAGDGVHPHSFHHQSCPSDGKVNRWNDYHMGAVKLALSDDRVRQRPQLR